MNAREMVVPTDNYQIIPVLTGALGFLARMLNDRLLGKGEISMKTMPMGIVIGMLIAQSRNASLWKFFDRTPEENSDEEERYGRASAIESGRSDQRRQPHAEGRRSRPLAA